MHSTPFAHTVYLCLVCVWFFLTDDVSQITSAGSGGGQIDKMLMIEAGFLKAPMTD